MAIKAAFLITLLLTILVGVTLLIIPCEKDIIIETSDSSYINSLSFDTDMNYDPYYQDSDDPELEPVKVYQKYKNDGITDVVKVVECNGNCNGKSYDQFK